MNSEEVTILLNVLCINTSYFASINPAKWVDIKKMVQIEL